MGERLIRYVHATEGPRWWCEGQFHPVPVRIVGLGHPAAPRGWPVHHCTVCGDDLFIEGRSAEDTAAVEAALAKTQQAGPPPEDAHPQKDPVV